MKSSICAVGNQSAYTHAPVINKFTISCKSQKHSSLKVWQSTLVDFSTGSIKPHRALRTNEACGAAGKLRGLAPGI
jgi:hypothetical protein